MTTRKRTDHLTDAERDALHRRIRAGESIAALARDFNLAQRTVEVHRAKVKGTHRTQMQEVAGVSTDTSHLAVDRVCWASGCFKLVTVPEKWCDRHSYRKPAVSEPVRLRMIGGR